MEPDHVASFVASDTENEYDSQLKTALDLLTGE